MLLNDAAPQSRGNRGGGAVGPENVSADVLALSSLSRIDYVDHFRAAHQVGVHISPERWARTMFGDAPDLTEKLLWSAILRLRLQAGASADTIAGWKITARGDDWIRTTAASRSATAELIIRATEGTLELATVVRYDRRRAVAVWRPTAFVHRQLVPVLLSSTARTMSKQLR